MLHKSTHATSDFTCPVCNKRFSRIASLKSHIMLHEKEEVGNQSVQQKTCGACPFESLTPQVCPLLAGRIWSVQSAEMSLSCRASSPCTWRSIAKSCQASESTPARPAKRSSRRRHTSKNTWRVTPRWGWWGSRLLIYFIWLGKQGVKLVNICAGLVDASCPQVVCILQIYWWFNTLFAPPQTPHF